MEFTVKGADASLKLAIGMMRGNDPLKSETELLKAKQIFEEIVIQTTFYFATKSC